MPTYTYRGDTPRNVADPGIDVTPGLVFESSVELTGPDFEPVTGKKPKPAEVVAGPAPEPPANPDEEVVQ